MSKLKVSAFPRISTLSLVLLAILFLPGADDAGQQLLAQGPPAAVLPVTGNDVFAEVGARVPEFGGMFVDEGADTLYVYMVPGGSRSAADLDQAITDVLGSDRPPESRLAVLDGQYSFVQLKEWHDLITGPVLSISRAVLTEVDQRNNRIKVGVETLDIEPDVEEVLAELAVPREAVNIEEMPPRQDESLLEPLEPAEPRAGTLQDETGAVPGIQDDASGAAAPFVCAAPCTLQSSIRPLIGGIQIQPNGGGSCTLGVIADYGLLKPTGLVTASHCTNRKGGIMNPTPPAPAREAEPTLFLQPTTAPATNQIGVESIDPCYYNSALPTAAWPPVNVPSAGDAACMSPPSNPPAAIAPPACPAGMSCRRSDSSFSGFRTITGGNVTFSQGLIARPGTINPRFCNLAGQPPCSLAWNGMDTFSIVQEGTVVVGQSVTKVGRTTGRTQGTVTAVGVSVIGGGPVRIISVIEADPGTVAAPGTGYWSQGGDSGSPVFQCLNPVSQPVACNLDDATNKVRIVGIHFLSGGTFSPIGNINRPAATGVQNSANELGPFFKCLPLRGC